MTKITLAIVTLLGLGALDSAAQTGFDALGGCTAKQVSSGAGELPDFPMPGIVPEPMIPPMPFKPSSDPIPFYLDGCMLVCPWGYNTDAGPCVCEEPFADWENEPAAKSRGGKGGEKGVADSIIPDTFAYTWPNIVCRDGIEYPAYAIPMKCDVDPAISDWNDAIVSYLASETTRARQPLLKDEALKYFDSVGNKAAAAAVAERSSRIFSDGRTLFVAGAGKALAISDEAAARRVYEKTFVGRGAAASSARAGVYQKAARDTVSCLASDSCWGGLAAN